MKFLLFADLHHLPGVFMGGTYEDLDLFCRRAQETGCDFIIHAGDFCHGPSTVPDYVKAYNDLPIPTYHCLGNHDTDRTPFEETIKAYNMPDDHYYFDVDGCRMIVLSTNYFLKDGQYIRYSGPNYHKISIYNRDYISPEQIEWLEEAIASSPYPCVLISHASVERRICCVPNRDEVLRVINEANKRKPHSVLMYINGHYHTDFIRILDGVCYFDMNSAAYCYRPNVHHLYPAELEKQYADIAHTINYNDPLHAIVTVEGTTITIEGMESSPFMGITNEMTDNPIVDDDGRPVTFRVQSAKITLG